MQRAPLPRAGWPAADTLTLSVFVDGGLIEAFAGSRVAITPLVSPSLAHGLPAQRTVGVSLDYAVSYFAAGAGEAAAEREEREEGGTHQQQQQRPRKTRQQEMRCDVDTWQLQY